MFSASRLSSNRSSGNSASFNTIREKEPKSIRIDGRNWIYSLAFLDDGEQIVSGGEEQKIRHWRIEGAKEVGTPMDTGGAVHNIAVSQDGKWVVGGTQDGRVMVWDADSHEKVRDFMAHGFWVSAVDVSPDGTKIATGSADETACVWSLSTGKRLLGPWQHDNAVCAVKYSPDGHLIASATWRNSVRIYGSWFGIRSGRLLVDIPVKVNDAPNQSLAWARDSKRLFALSGDGSISCFDASTGITLSKWPIHSCDQPRCIALASNGTFIAASADSTVSFWDVTTYKRIGPVIQHTNRIISMAISANYDFVMGGGKTITLRNIYNALPSSYVDDISPERVRQLMSAEITDLKDTIRSLCTHESPYSKIAHLEEVIQRLNNELSDSQRTAKREKDNLDETIKSLRAREINSDSKIASLEATVGQLRSQHADFQRRTSGLLRAHEQKHQCEALYAEGCIVDASRSVLDLTNALTKEIKANKFVMDWLANFTNQCISTLEATGDEALHDGKHDEALVAYSTAISLSPSSPNTLLAKWASTALTYESVDEALSGAVQFKFPRFHTYRAICDVLEGGGRVKEAVDCFQRMQGELGKDTSIDDEQTQWELSFRQRWTEKLEQLGDYAMDSGNYPEAAQHFSLVMSLNLKAPVNILVKRSKAWLMMNSWEDALSDADEAIKLNPPSHLGYEIKHAALHQAGRHTEGAEAFRTMLSKLDDSSDERIRALRHRYVDAVTVIRHIVEQTTRPMPRILIDTTTGRLHDKRQQVETFKSLPIYSELVSSMTKELDYARIWREVKRFCRYVMLSHKWEYDEPLLQKVEHISIHELEPSPANSKLQSFCSLVRSLGFRWAWSDTCCVDKVNNVVLQESLVAMFTWYRGSSLTIVYLRGITSEPRVPGGLRRSVWNTRAWTYQEYVAAEIVQFYTEDWKLYLGLTLPNHKESPAIISEMQQATGVSAQDLAVLQPGLDRVREKLYLASMRLTTHVEDIAYSLLGIFNVAIPVIYGEGHRAVGRLLEHVLTGSGDVTILAWTGPPGNYNSCLPVDLAVYNELVPPHIPQPIETTEMDKIVVMLRSSLPDLSLAVRLHERLNELLPPSLTSSRLRLPGIVFHLTGFRTSGPDSAMNPYVYQATTSTFGDIEIKTAEDLTCCMDHIYLFHPWIRPLLDQEHSDGAAALDKTTQALRVVAGLRQPFGALLFRQVSRVEYRRVAADSLILVRVREEAPLSDLIDNVRMIDVQ